MATLDDLINRLNKMSQDTQAMSELGNIIGSMMVKESKDSLFAPKSGTTFNKRTGRFRSAEGEPPAYDKGEFLDNTTHYVQVNKAGPTILSIHNDTRYASMVEIDYNRPFLSWGIEKVLEDRSKIESAINRVFYDFFKKGLG